MAAAPASGGPSQWRVWTLVGHKLLPTPEKAAAFAEAVVSAAYGPEQVEEERPFKVEDFGDEWRATGTRRGLHTGIPLPVSSVVTLNKLTGNIIDYTLTGASPTELAEQTK